MRFLLVDRIEAVEPGQGARAWKNAAMSEDYFEWHFPDRPVVPGMLVLEAFVQLAGWLEAVASDFERWFVLDRIESARYYAFAGPGDRIHLDLRVEEPRDADTVSERRAYRGESAVDGVRSAVVSFSGRLVPLAGLEEASRARRIFESLTGTKPAAAEGRS